jgi:hypothetical protein
MSTDLIRYDLLAQEALRGVVKRVLADVARTGVPGEHHFYISFNTQYPGVRISPRLREKYPDEMTVILQHQFWDLAVTDHSFEVGLSFSNIPEKLYVPFDAITGFFDPSVKFGLKFETITQIASDKPEKPAAPREAPKGARSEPQESPPTKKKAEKSAKDAKDESAAENGAQVVSLDKFRKK